MNSTWMGNGYAWDFFLVSCLMGFLVVKLASSAWSSRRCRSSKQASQPASARLALRVLSEWWRPGQATPTQPMWTQPNPIPTPQVPLGVSIGSLILCGVLNAALQRWWKQPAVSALRTCLPTCPPSVLGCLV